MSIYDQLAVVVSGRTRKNEWISDDYGQLYYRWTTRYLHMNGKYVNMRCLDIATIDINKQYQNTGIFSKLIDDIEVLLRSIGNVVLYIENIIPEFLWKHFEKRGYTLYSNDGACRSYYMKF